MSSPTNQQKRPKLLTAVSWFLIIGAIFGVILMLIQETSNNPAVLQAKTLFPIPAYLVYLTLVVLTTKFFVGIFLLGAHAKARVVYVSINALFLMHNAYLFREHEALIVGPLIFFLIISTVLFLPSNTAYFAKSNGS
jgi:hypothetical protein